MSEDRNTVMCAVAACPNNNTPGNARDDLTYHRFPKDPALKAAWVNNCMRPRNWPLADSSYVCSDHFDPTDFNYPEPGSHEISLSPDAIPSTRIKFSIKAEPIDVEEDFSELLNREGLEIILDSGTISRDLTSKMDQEESQYEFGDSDSLFLNNVGGSNTCQKCNREFKTHGRLKRHQLFCPPNEKKLKVGPRAGAGTACFVKDCKEKFYHRNKMLRHMEVAHNCILEEKQTLKFASMEEFWTWKENEEERTYSHFSKRTGNHKNTATYHCQRDGPSRARSDLDQNTITAKRNKTKGHIKENIVCLAHIKTILNGDGTVSATYFPSHNHPLSAMDYLHHPLSRATQMFIKEKLDLGYTPRQIADELLIRQNASGSNNPTNMTKNQFLHMVNKLDRIRGFLDRERKRMREEASGENFRRVRRSRKVIFEEQFQKSKQFQEEVRAGRQYLDDDDFGYEEDNTMSADQGGDQDQPQGHGYQDIYDDGSGANEEYVEGDYMEEMAENDVDDDLMGEDELVKTLSGATALVCKEDNIDQEMILDESEMTSSSNSNHVHLKYRDALLRNKKLAEVNESLRKKLAKKDKQIDLLINALKKSLSKGNSELDTLKETVSDGDYEIIVI